MAESMPHRYKLCKTYWDCIAAAICHDLDRTGILYNVAATNMSPLRRQLCWDEVVEYMFLLEFDLLRDVRQDLFAAFGPQPEVDKLWICISSAAGLRKKSFG